MSQSAFFLNARHGNFEVGTRPIPTPNADQLLVKVSSVGLNPADWQAQVDGFWIETFPAVLGTDIAGVVEKVGANVKRFSVGDRVFFQGVHWTADEGGLQHFTLVNTDIVSHIPSSLSEDQAATVPLTCMTGFVALFHPTGFNIPPPFEGPTAPNESIVIIGGSSQCGMYTIQLARIAGFKDIITTASLKHEAHLKSLGATHVLDRDSPDLEAKVRQLTGDALVFAVDAISDPETQLLAYSMLSNTKPGHLVTFHPPPEDRSEAPVKPEGTKWNGIYGSSHWHRDLSVPFWNKIGQWLQEEAIRPGKPVVLKGGLKAVPEGLDLLKSNRVSGEKLIVKPWDT